MPGVEERRRVEVFKIISHIGEESNCADNFLGGNKTGSGLVLSASSETVRPSSPQNVPFLQLV